METINLILNAVILIAIGLVGLLWKNSLGNYLSEKGRNLATKEDITDITDKVEEVKSSYIIEIEKLKVDLSLLSQKHTILFDEKIRVFKKLQKRLVKFKKYCNASVGTYGVVSEFHENLASLPRNIEKSALMHLTELRAIVEKDFIFLSEKSKKLLSKLTNHSTLESMEIHLHGSNSEDVEKGAAELYESLIKEIDECLIGLYEELEFPAKSENTED